MPSLNELSASSLLRQLGGPNSPMILDVRTDDDFELDPRLIPTSRRTPHTHILTVLPDIANRKVVIICQKGKKLSHGAAALLRANGIKAEVLEGGFLAWRDAAHPLSPTKAIPNSGSKGSLWVTRHRPRIDRIACPWLIRRFIDPNARFLFVPPSEVLNVADRFDALSLDCPGATWTHQDDHCTFDALLDGFGLSYDPLNRMATVIRAADTNQLEHSPQAAGLVAISVGLSRLHKEDQDQLSAGLGVYDALFRWARDGFDEIHDHDGDR